VYYLLLLAAIALTATTGIVRAQDRSFGDRLYHEKADCQFCHGIDGDGRGTRWPFWRRC
jgi:cytochrome c